MKKLFCSLISLAICFCTLTFSAPDFSANSSTESAYTRTYIRREFNSSGRYTGTSYYSLTTNVASVNNTARGVPGVIGTDDRYPDSNSSVIKLSVGTGFIVGENVIATAAHCVYNKYTKTYTNNVRAYLPIENSNSTLTCYPREIHIPSDYDTCISDDNRKYDYALLFFDRDLSEYGIFNLGVIDESSALSDNIPITVSGYPTYIEDSNGNSISANGHLYTGSGYLNGTENGMIEFYTDASAGQSGGPAYISVNYTIGNTSTIENTVVGICSGYESHSSMNNGIEDIFYNVAHQFTEADLTFFLKNDYIGESI